MAAAQGNIYLGSSTYLLLGNVDRLHDTADPLTPISGATVTATLVDQKTGVEIVADIDCPDVGGEAGLYRGIIDNDQAGLVEHQRVIVNYTVVDGPNRVLFKTLIAIVIIAT